jgi:cysteinyl-tRNA synthetase
MPEVPEEVRRLARRRDEARSSRDFAAADTLRDEIRSLGFEVTDTPDGPQVHAAPAEAAAAPAPAARVRAADVDSVLDRPATFDVSVQWIVEGWRDDVLRGIESFGAAAPARSVQHVVVDVTAEPGLWPDGVEVLEVAPGTGWAEGRNAGLVRSLGAVVLVVDGSVEATGDLAGPLTRALDDPSVGIAGPFGIVSDDLREFRESDGPRVDAIEAYLMALRRELLVDGLRFDRKFAFYRSADIEFSFRVKSMGLDAIVVPVPVRRHEHRMWAATPQDVRERLSKRNFYRFLDAWRGREDLLESRREG